MKQSDLITSAAVLLIADVPSALSSAVTDPAWHSRVQ